MPDLSSLTLTCLLVLIVIVLMIGGFVNTINAGKLASPQPAIGNNPCEAAILRILKQYVGGRVLFQDQNNQETWSTIVDATLTETRDGILLEVQTFRESSRRSPWKTIDPPSSRTFLFPVSSINISYSMPDGCVLTGSAINIGEFWLKMPDSP